VIAAPVIETPVVEVPVVETPVVVAPTVETPIVAAPVVEIPTVTTPTIESLVDEQSAVGVSAVEEPKVENPSATITNQTDLTTPKVEQQQNVETQAEVVQQQQEVKAEVQEELQTNISKVKDEFRNEATNIKAELVDRKGNVAEVVENLKTATAGITAGVVGIPIVTQQQGVQKITETDYKGARASNVSKDKDNVLAQHRTVEIIEKVNKVNMKNEYIAKEIDAKAKEITDKMEEIERDVDLKISSMEIDIESAERSASLKADLESSLRTFSQNLGIGGDTFSDIVQDNPIDSDSLMQDVQSSATDFNFDHVLLDISRSQREAESGNIELGHYATELDSVTIDEDKNASARKGADLSSLANIKAKIQGMHVDADDDHNLQMGSSHESSL
jgi:hypothetical protein